MKKRSADAGDSLELLLDTISNAFGGILFLAILLALLLRISHKKVEGVAVSPVAEYEMIEVEAQLAVALTELESLERAVDVQSAARNRLADKDLERQLVVVQNSRARRDDFQRSLLEARHAAAQEQIGLDAVRRRDAELDEKLEQARRVVASQREQFAKERQRRSQTIVPPRTRSTTKMECGLSLRYDRLYLEYKLGDGVFDQTLNTDDFILLGEKAGLQHITPNPLGGLAVQPGPEFTRDLNQKLAGYSPTQWYVVVIAWEDSFDQFQVLKSALMSLGYEFRILPAAPGDIFTEGPGVDPQVQ